MCGTRWSIPLLVLDERYASLVGSDGKVIDCGWISCFVWMCGGCNAFDIGV